MRRPTAILIQTLLSARDGDREIGGRRVGYIHIANGGDETQGMNGLSEPAQVRV